ncbi:MAG: cellulase N-terminal Ig-like domain-containing protein [Haloarculaceae archaeon]
MHAFVNQLGYERTGPKRAVVAADGESSPEAVRVVDADSGATVAERDPERAGGVADWDRGAFWTVAFDDLTRPGEYYLVIEGSAGESVPSRRFEVRENLLQAELLSDLLFSVTAQRWLGENSRIASLAAAAYRTADALDRVDGEWLRRFARDQLNWILGVNPFGAAMVRGVGAPLPDYLDEYPGVPGGVCNGITAAVGDPSGVAFDPEPQSSDPDEAWRWTEQWLPHAVWTMLALASAERV